MRVLVVEDSMTMRRIVIDSLRAFPDVEAVEAESGEKALQMLRDDPKIGLVLLDWHLPGMSGLDVVRRMRQDGRLASVPAVMVTSERTKANVIAALRAGVMNYIVKPFTQQVFRKKIGPLVTKSEPEAQGARPAGSLVGQLAQTSPLEVVQLISMTKKTGVLELDGSCGRFAIFFRNGQLDHAEGEGLSGEEAFNAAVVLTDGVFTFRTEVPAHPPTIRRTTEMIVLEAFRHGRQG